MNVTLVQKSVGVNTSFISLLLLILNVSCGERFNTYAHVTVAGRRKPHAESPADRDVP